MSMNVAYAEVSFSFPITLREVLFEFHLKFWNTASIDKVDRLLTGLTAQLKGTTARRYSKKTSLTL